MGARESEAVCVHMWEPQPQAGSLQCQLAAYPLTLQFSGQHAAHWRTWGRDPVVALEEDQNCPLSLQMTGQSTGRSPTPCERDDRCTNTVHGKRPCNTSKSKPLVGILLRCCEDADKNKSTVSIDGTAGTFLRNIRRTVKRLSQKDIPEHKARGDTQEQRTA